MASSLGWSEAEPQNRASKSAQAHESGRQPVYYESRVGFALSHASRAREFLSIVVLGLRFVHPRAGSPAGQPGWRARLYASTRSAGWGIASPDDLISLRLVCQGVRQAKGYWASNLSYELFSFRQIR
jgi:hypothetical protein